MKQLRKFKTIKRMLLAIVTCLSFIILLNAAKSDYENIVYIARFSNLNLEGWKNKFFKGETKYTLEKEDKVYFLKAISMQSASALYKKIKVNIQETPYLNWRWKIDRALPQLNEKQKTGDDYAARVYVVIKTGLTPLSAKALNYIWSSNGPPKVSWPNAYTKKAIMIPLRSNIDDIGIWQHEKVNVKEDLMHHFRISPNFIDGVAIMTDTDNSNSIAIASYGDIYFSSN